MTGWLDCPLQSIDLGAVAELVVDSKEWLKTYSIYSVDAQKIKSVKRCLNSSCEL